MGMTISAPVGVEMMTPATKELLQNIEQFEAKNEPSDCNGIIGSPSSLSIVSAMSTADEADIDGIVSDEEEDHEEERKQDHERTSVSDDDAEEEQEEEDDG